MKTVVAAALGECVHVAGVMNFLRLAEQTGWRTVFLGPAVPVERVLAAAQREGAGRAVVVATGMNTALTGMAHRRTAAAGRGRQARTPS